MPDLGILLPVAIFFARVVDVSIGTVRIICVTRGRRLLAVILGFFEVLIWIMAISAVFAHLDRWINIVAFAGGFAAGNAVGIAIERTIGLGTQIVQFISRGKAQAVAERLRFADLAVTMLSGEGRHGPVAICMAIVPRRLAGAVIEMARQIDPDVVVTVEDVAESSAGQASTHLPGKRMLPVPFNLAEQALRLLPRPLGRRRAAPLRMTRAS